MTTRERPPGTNQRADISAAGTGGDTSTLREVRHRRRHLEVEFVSRHDCILRGPVRELYVSTTGRAPVWISARNGFGCQERTARTIIAAAEHAGFDITIVGPRSAPARVPAPATSAPEQPDPAQGLW